MSHEIRTPLNGIIGMAQLLEEKAIDAESKEYIQTIKGSSDLLLTVINDILDFSKIEAGKLNLEYTWFDLHSTIQEIKNLFKKDLDENFVRIDLVMTNNVPNYICTDQVRLKQILINLIGNAVKFTEKGKIVLIIDAIKLDDDFNLKFTLSDTGIGFKEEAQKNLFNSFTQADNSTTRKYGGSGLGLSISKSLVKLLGGKIGVKSKIGKGSHFYFNIITTPPSENQVISFNKKEIKVDIKLGETHPLKILIVEDNIINQKIISRFLKKLGYESDIANDGIEALELISNKKFNLVFMDMQMPRMDGVEATIKIRSEKQHQGLQIYAMTANVLPQDRQKCNDAGMNGFMAKPVKIKELSEVLTKVYDLS